MQKIKGEEQIPKSKVCRTSFRGTVGPFLSACVDTVDLASWLAALILRRKRNSCALCHSKRNKRSMEQNKQLCYLFTK